MNVFQQTSVLDEWSGELRLKIADSLFNNLNEGICVTDAGEQIIAVNPTFCRLSGYSNEELLGKTPGMLNSGLQNHEFFATMWSVLIDTGEWHGELWNRNKAGELFAVRLNISSICNGSGKVTHYLAIMADITTEKIQTQEWEKNATHDQLTGLPNRVLLMDRLSLAMAQSQRTELLLAICYVDIDGFKPVNDLYGHKTGDHVLVELSKRLHHAIREGDTVARVGGDEFVILLWGLVTQLECDETLARVLADIEQPVSLGDAEISVTASIGVAMFPIDGKDPVRLIAQADSAMYRSKIAGGNRFTHLR